VDHNTPEDPVRAAARLHFGIPYLFPYQRLVIGNVLEAMDAESGGEEIEDLHDRQIVILPTGAGKSLCFQLPARMRPGLTVVLFPLLSLMADQERRMRETGFGPALLSGALEPEAKRRLWERLAREPGAMLLTNPESTVTPAVRKRLRALGVSHLVIDEAHCVTEWGESFRPAYRSLASLIEEIEPKVVTAFTATASPRILDDLRELLFPDGAHLIRADPDRPNITYALLPTLSRQRSLRLLYEPTGSAARLPIRVGPRRVGGKRRGAVAEGSSITGEGAGNLPALGAQGPAPLPSIVFCRSRGEAERTAACLRRYLPADRCYFYHAGLSRDEKKEVEDWFFASPGGVLAATCAYGMGVDKKDIKSVVHLRPAPSIESYLQESGRGGRDGSPAQAALLLTPSDLQGIDPGGRDALYLRRLLSPGCRRQALLEALGAENESCSGCDSCNRTAAAADPPLVAFRGNRLWPVIDGKLLASTVTATVTPGVRESRSFLSPYWGGCADWTEEEVKEAEEERMVAARLREEWGEAGGMLFPGQELRSGRGALFSRGG
jgi:ATP-dependent DNA helicase RecQ